MRAMTSPSRAFIEWINETRALSPMLDDDADALLARLNAVQARETALHHARTVRRTLGLYGHSQAAKAWLLTALCGDDARLEVTLGPRTFDYFAHINPGHAPARMALRFTPERTQYADDAFPLRLRILSEAELVQLFIAFAARNPAIRPVERAIIDARLEKWRGLCQAQPVAGITASETAAIARFWQAQMPGGGHAVDDALWHQFATLAPCLDLSTRASLWGLLWGEQHELTQQWLRLAQVLHQTSHARELAAPLSLLVDNFGLPGEFLTRGELTGAESQEAALHPLTADGMLSAVSIPLDTLALLTCEVVLPVENALLGDVDIIDMPAPGEGESSSLAGAKYQWLLEHYRQALEPDVLAICNATARHDQTADAATALMRWAKETQPAAPSALPGLVWAITPHDARLVTGVNLDEAVQQLLSQAGQRWGTLQALDGHSIRQVVEWLSQATLPARRLARLQAVEERLRETRHSLMQGYGAAKGLTVEGAQTLVRTLQQNAARHGELLCALLPPLTAFETLLAVQPGREEQVTTLFSETIDLFADASTQGAKAAPTKDKGRLAHRIWVNHLRQWSRSEAAAARLGLDTTLTQQLADVLISTSYRLRLPGQLQAIVEEDNSAARLHAALGNFIGWLGYGQTPAGERPASRVRKGEAIFATPVVSHTAPRLTRLGEQPLHAATTYVYDWLVALYTRATENGDAPVTGEIPPAARQTLQGLLT